MRTINFGLQYMYAFNYTKFSLKASFVFNEVQIKSAGSPIIGASFNMFVMDADSSIVALEVSQYFHPNLHMRDLNVINISVSIGYMYTYIFKKNYFVTLSLTPGINMNGGDYSVETRNFISPNLHFKFNSMNAIGYNGRRFFTGVQFLIDNYISLLEKKLTAEIGYGKLSFFVGYRFKRKSK